MSFYRQPRILFIFMLGWTFLKASKKILKSGMWIQMLGSDLIGILACSEDRCFVWLFLRCGYATLHHVVDKSKEDRMESFFLSETCKYLYLVSCLLLSVLPFYIFRFSLISSNFIKYKHGQSSSSVKHCQVSCSCHVNH